MSLAFPHEDGCPCCETTCDDVLKLHREIRMLRRLLIGALWCAATGSRPQRGELNTLENATTAAEEAMAVSAVLEGQVPLSLLELLFPTVSESGS